MSNVLKIVTYNVCGISTKLSNSDFLNCLNHYDIACLTETFASKDVDTSIFPLHEIYNSHAKKLSKQGRLSGGVIVLVRKSIHCYVKRIPVNVENIIVLKLDKKLFRSDKDIMFIAAYIPPYDSNYWKTAQDGFGIELLEQCLHELYSAYDEFSILISGDVNARTSDQNLDFSLTDDIDSLCIANLCEKVKRNSQDTCTNRFGEQLLDFCNIYDCFLLNGLCKGNHDDSFTFLSDRGSSVIDYFVLSFDLYSKVECMHLCVLDAIDSDHFPVELSVHLVVSDFQLYNANEHRCKNEVRQKLVWQKEKESGYVESLKENENAKKLDSATSCIESDVDKAVMQFNGFVKSAADCMIKKFTASEYVKKEAWFDDECKVAKTECMRKLRIFRRSRTSLDLNEYLDKKKTYTTLRKLKRQSFRRDKAELLSKNVNNSTLFWKEARILGGSKRNVLANGISLDDWFHHFKNVFKQCEDVETDERTFASDIEENAEHILNMSISKDEVRQAIARMKNNKSGGLDGVVPEMLKCGGEEIVDFLSKLFNRIFDCGIYPTEWSKAIVVPIFKKGDSNLPDNYRGISLINVACKCYTSILNRRLYSWMEDNGVIAENQAGFRRAYSTTDQIYNLYAVIQKCMSRKGQKLYVAFIDFKKAFDSVNHEKLLEVAYKGGIKGKFFCALKVMYESLVSCVRVKNEFSDMFQCPVGVRQGCVMSPTLFSLFINQLADHINEAGIHGVQLLPNMLELFLLLFADDVALLSTSPRGLQAQLNSLKICCERLKLSVNKNKTKIMVFRKGGFLAERERWYFENEILEVVNKYCYLGFNFTTKLSFEIGTSHLVAKGKKAVYLVCRVFQNCKEMCPSTFFKLFDSKVLPILLYSSEIWGYQRLDLIERVHMLACKRFLGVPLKTPNKMVYGELGRYPLYINSSVRCIRYWFKVLQMEPNRLPRQAYSMLVLLDESGKRNWVTCIKELLQSLGFDYVWRDQGVLNTGGFLKSFRQRMIDKFTQEWNLTVRHKDRYVIYSSVTSNFGRADYIDNIDIYCFRVALCQIRLGVLPINNNMNRYGDNPRVSMCPFCPSQIEDEKHFLTICPEYEYLRVRFLGNLNCHSFYEMIEGNDTGISRTVSKYVFHAIKRRQQCIDN